jgi:AmiR/NasT family two-component response regulator
MREYAQTQDQNSAATVSSVTTGNSHAVHLRVLIASERLERLEQLAPVVAGLGHEVIAQELSTAKVATGTARERADVALVDLGPDPAPALGVIEAIVHEATCPVIAMLPAKDPASVREAARRGIFAYVLESDPDDLQSAIDITVQRFGEYQSLQGAFGRRAVIEQAKGIMMARHGVSADGAFAMLREHSQHSGHKVADVAQAVVESHQLLGPPVPE